MKIVTNLLLHLKVHHHQKNVKCENLLKLIVPQSREPMNLRGDPPIKIAPIYCNICIIFLFTIIIVFLSFPPFTRRNGVHYFLFVMWMMMIIERQLCLLQPTFFWPDNAHRKFSFWYKCIQRSVNLVRFRRWCMRIRALFRWIQKYKNTPRYSVSRRPMVWEMVVLSGKGGFKMTQLSLLTSRLKNERFRT